MESDAQRIPTCYRHDLMVERMANVESTVKELQRSVEKLRADENECIEWRQEHMQKAQWFYDHEESIKNIVTASQWAVISRRVVAYLLGAIVSVGMTLVWLKENLHKFTG